MNEWQPIETVPRDKRWYQIRDAYGRVGMGQFGPEDWAFNIRRDGFGFFGPLVEWKPVMDGQ